jgi:hypothetical protein
MWRFAEIILIWILRKLGTSASAADLTRILHQHLLDLGHMIGEMRARCENVGLLSRQPEEPLLKDLVKAEIKPLKSLIRRLVFCEVKISRSIYRLRFFLARENCEFIYHELYTILRNINKEKWQVLSNVDHIYFQIKERRHEYISRHGNFLYKQVPSLRSIEANIQKSINDLLSFGRGTRSGGA